MAISFLKNWICPLDTTITEPLIGRIDEEDTIKGQYLVASYTLASVQQGFVLLDTEDLSYYRIFKGVEEAKEYVQANWPV